MAASIRAGVPGFKRRLRCSSRVGVARVLITAVVVALVAKSGLDVAVGWISAPLGGLHSLRRARVQGRRHALLMGQGAEASADGEKPATTPLEQLKMGDIVDGRVTRRCRSGVLVDIGADVLALLMAPKEEAFKLEPSEILKGLFIESVRLGEAEKKGQVDVYFAGLSELVAGRPERPRSGTPEETKKAVGKVVLDGNDFKGQDGAKVVVELRGLTFSSASKNQQTITLIKGKKGVPFADLVVGQSLKGRVRNKNKIGVWIDVGKERDALYEPHEKMHLLDWGEELDFVVSTLNHKLGQATVNLPDLEQHVAGREQKLTALKDLVAGSVVTGHITTIKKLGSWVDIGAEKDAFITVAATRKNKLELGQEVTLRLMSIDTDKQEMKVELVEQ